MQTMRIRAAIHITGCLYDWPCYDYYICYGYYDEAELKNGHADTNSKNPTYVWGY